MDSLHLFELIIAMLFAVIALHWLAQPGRPPRRSCLALEN